MRPIALVSPMLRRLDGNDRLLRASRKRAKRRGRDRRKSCRHILRSVGCVILTTAAVLVAILFFETDKVQLIKLKFGHGNRKHSAINVRVAGGLGGDKRLSQSSVLPSLLSGDSVYTVHGDYKHGHDEEDADGDGYDYKLLNTFLSTHTTSKTRKQRKQLKLGRVPDVLTTRRDIRHRTNIGSVQPSNETVDNRDNASERKGFSEGVHNDKDEDKGWNVPFADATNTTKIKKIALLGERNSGTTWITGHLKDCFGHALDVSVTLVRHKHWFQHDILPKRRVPGTLVVSVYRNPCAWAEAMREKSYRSPFHYRVKDWRTFVTTPWTMPRLDHDLELLGKYKRDTGNFALNTSTIQCQKYFTYNQINACLEKPYLDGAAFQKRAANRAKRKSRKYGDSRDERSGQEPFYELRNDGSGLPYATVMDMRSDKIKNFLEIYLWGWIEAVISIQYEEMVRLGTASLIDNVEKVTGIEAQCDPFPPQNRTPRELPSDMVEWMGTFVDWDTEYLIGYERC